MLTEPLPSRLDVRKAAVRGVGVNGVLKPLDLKRFRPLLADDEGVISVEMTFSRDEGNRYLVTVAIEADIAVTCQRCLQAMPEHLSSKNTLAVVWTEDDAVHLPKHLDPLVLMDQTCSLWELVEDELILAIRPFSYHDTEECKQKIMVFSDPVPHETIGQDKPNPFKVLGHLISGK